MDWITLAHRALEYFGAFSVLCILIALVCLSFGEFLPRERGPAPKTVPPPSFNRAQGDRLADREGREP